MSESTIIISVFPNLIGVNHPDGWETFRLWPQVLEFLDKYPTHSLMVRVG
jgi:hypothetical protein